MGLAPVNLNQTGVFNANSGAIAIAPSHASDAIFVLVAIADPFSNGVTAITDNAGNSYARQINNANAGGYVDLWAAFNVNAGASSISISVSPSDKFTASVDEFSGVAPATALDATWKGSDAANNLYFFNGGGQPATQTGELAIGLGTANSLIAPGAASNGWTALTDVTADSLLAGAYTIGSSTTIPQTVRAFGTVPPNEVMLAATFKPAR